MQIARTRRLVLRQLVLADARFLCRLLNEPSWLENIGDRGVRTIADAERYIQDKLIGTYASLGFGMYLTLLGNNQTAIGLCGLVKRASLPEPDLGFAFLPEYWGNGYAFEAAVAVMHFARVTLGLSTLLAIVKPDNARSVRLLEKLDFTREGEYRVPSSQELVSLYGATL